jgi:hypothetical protein
MASACGIVLGGMLYLSRTEYLPYHAQAVGMPWESVPVRSQVLFLALMHSVGALGIGLGCAVGSMVAIPFRRAEPWADWAIPGILLPVELIGLSITVEVAARTGAHAPWPVVLAGILVTLAGIAFCWSAKRKRG